MPTSRGVLFVRAARKQRIYVPVYGHKSQSSDDVRDATPSGTQNRRVQNRRQSKDGNERYPHNYAPDRVLEIPSIPGNSHAGKKAGRGLTPKVPTSRTIFERYNKKNTHTNAVPAPSSVFPARERPRPAAMTSRCVTVAAGRFQPTREAPLLRRLPLPATLRGQREVRR